MSWPPKGRASLTDYGNLRSGGRGLVQEEGHGLVTGNSGYKVLGKGRSVGVGGDDEAAGYNFTCFESLPGLGGM